MMRRAFLSMAVVLCGVAAGCASTPQPQLFVLSPTAAQGAASTGPSVAIGPVTIPSVVNRPQIVVGTGANEVRIDEFHRWASPLQDNLSLVIALDLARLLGTTDVSASQPAAGLDPDYRIAVDVQRIESTLGKAALLDAIWTVRSTRRGALKKGHSIVDERVADDSYDALVAAHSRAVGRLSADIADAIRTSESAVGHRRDASSPNASA